MTAAELVTLARMDGVTMVVNDAGDVTLRGPPEVAQWWAPKVRTAKASIVSLLRPLATVVIEAHGHRFAIATGDGAPDAEGCIMLTAAEVARLGAAAGGAPLPASIVHAIARAKAVFPDADVSAARIIGAESEGADAVQEP